MDLVALKSELDTDPTNLGYAEKIAAGDDAGVATLLNAKTFRGPVPIEVLSAYCTKGGLVGAVKALIKVPLGSLIAEGVPMTIQIKGLLYTVETLLVTDYRLSTADVDDPAFGAALDGLVGLDIASAGQKAAILTLADNRLSRAEVLLGQQVSSDNVAAAFGRV